MFLDFGPFEEYIGLLIFLARMLDVTLGTIRNLYVNAGLKISSAVAGFFQMIVWVFAVAGLVNDLNDISRIILYALGLFLPIITNTKNSQIQNSLEIKVVSWLFNLESSNLSNHKIIHFLQPSISIL